MRTRQGHKEVGTTRQGQRGNERNIMMRIGSIMDVKSMAVCL